MWLCDKLGHKFRTTTVRGEPDFTVVDGLKSTVHMAKHMLEASRPVLSIQTYCTRCGVEKPE